MCSSWYFWYKPVLRCLLKVQNCGTSIFPGKSLLLGTITLDDILYNNVINGLTITKFISLVKIHKYKSATKIIYIQ